MDFIGLARQVLDGGGFTISTVPGRNVPDRGYMVSLEGFEVSKRIGPNEAAGRFDSRVAPVASLIESYADAFTRALAAPGCYLGAWLDGDRVVLDVSVWYAHPDTARVAAWDNRQRAFYDLESCQTIPTKRIG